MNDIPMPPEIDRLTPADALHAVYRSGLTIREADRPALIAAFHDVIRENQDAYREIVRNNRRAA